MKVKTTSERIRPVTASDCLSSDGAGMASRAAYSTPREASYSS